MFELDGGRPGDRRGFVHKRLIRAVGGFVRGGPTGAVAGLLSSPSRPPARDVIPRELVERNPLVATRGKETGRQLKFGPEPSRLSIVDRAKRVLGFNGNGDDGCVPPFRRDPGTGKCKVFVGERAGPNGGRDVGEAVMGRYGAGLQPGIMTIDRAVCLPGMQLGDDGLCYNKGQITNKQRMWPRGRRPLLTGGQMRAIGIASSAAKTVERTTKRLQELGMLKKPMPRRTKGKTVVVHEAHDHHHSDH